jgi:hypothetical protein
MFDGIVADDAAVQAPYDPAVSVPSVLHLRG